MGQTLPQGGACACVYIRITMVMHMCMCHLAAKIVPLKNMADIIYSICNIFNLLKWMKNWLNAMNVKSNMFMPMKLEIIGHICPTSMAFTNQILKFKML